MRLTDRLSVWPWLDITAALGSDRIMCADSVLMNCYYHCSNSV